MITIKVHDVIKIEFEQNIGPNCYIVEARLMGGSTTTKYVYDGKLGCVYGD